VEEATAIAASVRSRYPLGKTGNLRAHVKVDITPTTGDAVLVRVTSTARHSHLYEYGTKQRHTTGASRGVSTETAATARIRQHLGLPMRFRRSHSTGGANRGVMPANPMFVPEAITKRASFMRRVRQILASAEPAIGSGLPTVTGSE
jgi:hypothetical protein